MEKSELLKPCGAEEYAWYESEMECSGTKWMSISKWTRSQNVMQQNECIFRKHIDNQTRHIFYFSAQLMGGGVFWGIHLAISHNSTHFLFLFLQNY